MSSWWDSWVNGNLQPTATLIGVSIQWWGRIGKVLEYFAGSTIILDLIGEDSLRDFGQRGTLRARQFAQFRLARRASFLRYIVEEPIDRMLERARVDGYRGNNRALIGMLPLAIGVAEIILAAVLGYFLISFVTFSGWGIPLYFIWIILACFASILAAMLSFALFLLMLGFVRWLPYYFLGLASLISSAIFHTARPGRVVRWLALFMLIIGFPLDFMAS